MQKKFENMYIYRIFQFIDFKENSWFRDIASWLIISRFETGTRKKSGYEQVQTKKTKKNSWGQDKKNKQKKYDVEICHSVKYCC